MIHYRETRYGFEWGACKIERVASDKKRGWVVLEMASPKVKLQMYVTKTGKVRLYEMTGDGPQELPL